MGALKWIGGFLGWVTLGPIGALIGFIFGSMTESGLEVLGKISSDQDGTGPARTYRRTYTASSSCPPPSCARTGRHSNPSSTM